MVPVTLLADDGIHAAFGDHVLLADIACIKPQVLSLVLFLYKRRYDVES